MINNSFWFAGNKNNAKKKNHTLSSSTLFYHKRITRPCIVHPLHPTFILKIGVYRGIFYFLALTYAVLTCTRNLCKAKTRNIENFIKKKNQKTFSQPLNFCIMHGNVCVMIKLNLISLSNIQSRRCALFLTVKLQHSYRRIPLRYKLNNHKLYKQLLSFVR